MKEYIVNAYGRMYSVYADVELETDDNGDPEVQDILIETIHEINDSNLDAMEYDPTQKEMNLILLSITDQAMDDYFYE